MHKDSKQSKWTRLAVAYKEAALHKCRKQSSSCKCPEMSYRSPYNMSLRLLLLLMMLYEARTLPALDSAPAATAANSIEETDKLPNTHIEPIASSEAVLINANTSNQTDAGNNEALEPTVVSEN